MFVPLPCILAMLLPTLIGMPLMTTGIRPSIKYPAAGLLALLAILAFAASMMAFGPQTAPYPVIEKIAYL